MPNITMTIDEKTLKKARKVAVEKNTTLTALIRNYLETISETEEQQKHETIKKLKRIFKSSGVVVKKSWNRDDLYER